jgi:hypothetical protein
MKLFRSTHFLNLPSSISLYSVDMSASVFHLQHSSFLYYLSFHILINLLKGRFGLIIDRPESDTNGIYLSNFTICLGGGLVLCLPTSSQYHTNCKNVRTIFWFCFEIGMELSRRLRVRQTLNFEGFFHHIYFWQPIGKEGFHTCCPPKPLVIRQIWVWSHIDFLTLLKN